MERMKAYVSLDDQSYNKKPLKKEIPKIKYRAVSGWKEMDIKELAELRTCCCAQFKCLQPEIKTAKLSFLEDT